MFKEIFGLENLSFEKSKTISKEKKLLANVIVGSARVVRDSLDSLPKFHGINFAVSITWKNSAFIKTEEIGENVSESSKRMALLHAYSQRQDLERCDSLNKPNNELPKHDGAIHIDDLVISVYGADEMNSAIAIGIAVGTKIISYDKGGTLAREYGCLSGYSENAEVMTRCFYDKNTTSATDSQLD